MSSLMTRGGLFDDFFKDIAPGFYVRPLHGDPLPSPAQIKVDVKETDKGYTVEAEVPGVSKDEIHVSLDGNVVTLRAEVKQEDRQGSDEKSAAQRALFRCCVAQLPAADGHRPGAGQGEVRQRRADPDPAEEADQRLATADDRINRVPARGEAAGCQAGRLFIWARALRRNALASCRLPCRQGA
jgi:HSP20 family protein